METESKPRSHHRKKRERANKLLPDPSDSEGERNLDGISRLIASKDRSRSKPRKKKGTGTYEEDIIDGFAIVSFRSIEDLAKFAKDKLVSSTSTKKNDEIKCNTRNHSLSPANCRQHHHHNNHHHLQQHLQLQQHKNKNQTANNLQKSKHNNCVSRTDSVSSGETTDNLDASDLILYGLTKQGTRRYSDCDSESGDERVSNDSLDVFSTKPVSNTIKCDPALPAILPPVSTHSSTITTATPTSTTTISDVFVTTVNSMSCVSLNNNNLPVVAVTVTSGDNNNRNHHKYHTHQQQQQQSYSNPNPLIETKYSNNSNHQKKCLNETYTNNSLSVIKRRPLSPSPLTKSSQSPSPRPKNSCSSSALSTASLLPVATSSSVISRALTRPSSRAPRREEFRDRDAYQVLSPNLSVSKSFSPGYPDHGSFPATLYNPVVPGPGQHPLHSTASQSATFPVHHSHHPIAAAQSYQPHHSMFAPPMAIGLPGGPPTAHMSAESPLSNPDLLREELNHRFLASQERSPFMGSMPPLLRADIHQHMHQHQHQHQHMHQHTYHGGMAPPSISTPSIVPATPSNPFDKLPGSTLYWQGPLPLRPSISEPALGLLSASKDKSIVPKHPNCGGIVGLPGYPMPMSDVLHSGLPGAFQPKGLAGLHRTAVDPLFITGRDLEKPTSLLTAPPASLPTAKKPGKWCAVHVRIAWEIYHHQQKQMPDKCNDSKSMEPLRPPSHILSGGPVVRVPDQPSIPCSTLFGIGRGLFDSSPHSIQNSANHLAPSFSRPSPYFIGTTGLPVCLGNGLPSTSREPSQTASSMSHEWTQPHRTPPTFPSPWAKIEDREKEADREREISLDRRRQEDRERERRLLQHDRHRLSTLLDNLGRDREHYRESDQLAQSRSRSRSRSPMRNGRVDSVKLDRCYDRRTDDNSVLKVKEERRESFTREDEIMSERERLLKNDYLGQANSLRTTEAFMQANMMERARMLTPASLLAADRVHGHPSFWNPLNLQNQQLGLQRDIEQARDHFFNRYSMSGLSQGFPVGLSPFEQDRYREEMILREKRDYIERLPVYERERLYYENSKMVALRPDHIHASLAHNLSRNISPAIHSHIKRTSPSVMPGAPPPLVHSGSASNPRGHSSLAVNKTKGVSPMDSIGESKRDSNSNSTDPDAHSR